MKSGLRKIGFGREFRFGKMRIMLEMGPDEIDFAGKLNLVEQQRFGESGVRKIHVAQESRAREIAGSLEFGSAEVCFSMELRISKADLALKLGTCEIGILKNLALEIRDGRIRGGAAHKFCMLAFRARKIRAACAIEYRVCGTRFIDF